MTLADDEVSLGIAAAVPPGAFAIVPQDGAGVAWDVERGVLTARFAASVRGATSTGPNPLLAWRLRARRTGQLPTAAPAVPAVFDPDGIRMRA